MGIRDRSGRITSLPSTSKGLPSTSKGPRKGLHPPYRPRMSITIIFPSLEAMEQVLAMGTEEGLTQAIGQIDAVLAEDAAAPRR
jgi:hypothetical protein